MLPTVSLMPTNTPSRSSVSSSFATLTGTASASATATPTPTQTPSTTSTLAIKVLIAQVPSIYVNFTPAFTTNILEIIKTDNLVYIPISLIIVAGIAYVCWKNRKATKKAPPVEEAVISVPAVVKSVPAAVKSVPRVENSLKQMPGKGKVQIRVPGVAV